MKSFESQLLSLTSEKEGVFKGFIHEDWLQGRSTFGGLSAAMAFKAVRLALPEDQQDRPLRSILVTFAGPIPGGEIEIHTKQVRTGKSVSVIHVDVVSSLGHSLVMSAVFGGGRETKSVPYAGDFPAEPLDAAQDTPFVKGMMPGFMEAFRVRWTGGGIPVSNTAARRLGMWARHKTSAPGLEVEEMIAMGDVPPPIMMSHYKHRITGSSLTWSLEFLQDPRGVSSDWFYLDYNLEAASQGYSQQAGRVFADDGSLVAISHQCMTFFE